MADQNTRVERERIGTTIDEEITGLESRQERERVGSFADTEPGSSRPRAAAPRASTPTAAKPARTREIRAEIEQTREDLSETVNAIQDRLQPSALAANAMDSAKDAARERLHDIADTETVQYVRANPMPTAMIGIGLAGLAWLAFGRENPDTYARGSYGRRDWRAAAGYEYERDPQVPRGRMDYDLSGRSRGAGAEGRQIVQQTRQTARQAQTTLRRTWDDNPLLIGAAAAVVGALVAASMPATESENRLMGETRDQMVEGVQQAVKDKVQAVEDATTNAVSQVRQAVGLESSEQPGEDYPRG